MYVNAKMRPVETVPGMGARLKDSSGGVNSSMIYILHCTFVNATMSPYPVEQEKKNKEDSKCRITPHSTGYQEVQFWILFYSLPLSSYQLKED
jgi:hypothetical protein